MTDSQNVQVVERTCHVTAVSGDFVFPAGSIAPWAVGFLRRETALLDLVQRWRESSLNRRVLPSTARDDERARCAAELEAVLESDVRLAAR